MQYSEKRMDLFTVSAEYALVHCISADFAMGAGIAKRFTAIGTKTAIIELCGKPVIDYNGHTDRWSGDGYCIPVIVKRNPSLRVYNLVTKERYWEKPTLETMKSALEHLKGHIKANGQKKLAMPKIGCGLDRLEWPKVREIIQDVFKDTEIEILVCYQ